MPVLDDNSLRNGKDAAATATAAAELEAAPPEADWAPTLVAEDPPWDPAEELAPSKEGWPAVGALAPPPAEPERPRTPDKPACAKSGVLRAHTPPIQ